MGAVRLTYAPHLVELDRALERGYLVSHAAPESLLWRAWRDRCQADTLFDLRARIMVKHADVLLDTRPALVELTEDGHRRIRAMLRMRHRGGTHGTHWIRDERVPVEGLDAVLAEIVAIVRECSTPRYTWWGSQP